MNSKEIMNNIFIFITSIEKLNIFKNIMKKSSFWIETSIKRF